MNLSRPGASPIVIDSRQVLAAVFVFCLLVELGLVWLDLSANWWRWSDSRALRRLFNITREDGLASWFAVIQTAFVALTAWILYLLARQSRAAAWQRGGWLLTAVFFAYLCMDDGAAIHERLGTAFERSTGVGSFPSYPWQYLLLPAFAVAGLLLLLFLWRELNHGRERLKLMLAMACLVLAVGLDFVEGMRTGYPLVVQLTGAEGATVRHFSKSLEEFLEMLAMTIFLILFLGHLADSWPRLDLRLTPRR